MKILPFEYAVRNLGRSPGRMIMSVGGSLLVVLLALTAGGFVIGAPSDGRRKFVVSHGWESEVHPSPSGGKMRRLADALTVLEADDEDLVFFDFCSNSQADSIR